MLTEPSPRARGPGHLLSSSTTRLESHGDKHGETWTTKKKVEVVTTKNIERTIQRQVVLEDGRVLDEEIPVVTVDTIENKEIFETDHDEEQDNNYNDRRRGGPDLGDKVTTFKTTKDVTENVTKTEASHKIGKIAQRDIPIVIKDKKNLKNLMRPEARGERALSAQPRLVQSARKHQTITDTQRTQERNVRRGGKIVFEKIKTEEHEVYNSNDSDTSDDGGDFEKIEYSELSEDQPLEYKTRTEESFIEYFQKGEPGMEMVGEGPRYKTETKQYNKNKATALKNSQSPRRQLKQSRSWDNDTNNKLQAGPKPLSSNYSSSLNDLSRNSEERVFIAKVIEETPAVRLRNKKKQDLSKYLEHRQSANFSSSGEAMRSSASRSYLYPNCRVLRQQRGERPVSLDITDNFYFSDCVKQSQSRQQNNSSRLRQEKKYHSSLDISEKPKQIEIKIERPQRSHYSMVPSLSSDSINQGQERQICTRSLVRKGEKFQSVGDICFTTSKELQTPSSTKKTREVRTRSGPAERKMSGQLIFTSEKQGTPARAVEKSLKTASCTNLSTISTRVIPIEVSSSCLSSPGSPATKYRTRVAVHGHG